MSPWAWILIVWVGTVAALSVVAVVLHRRSQRDESTQPASVQPLMVGGAARWLHERVLSMSKGEVRRRFDVIASRELSDLSTLDAHFDRLAEDVVPGTAKPRKPKPYHDGGNK